MRGVVPKVVRDMAEIRYVVGFRTNLQLVVLKILSVVSCEERGVLFFSHRNEGFVFFSVREFFCFVGENVFCDWSSEDCIVVRNLVPKVIWKMAKIYHTTDVNHPLNYTPRLGVL